jgi:hypothetical protein
MFDVQQTNTIHTLTFNDAPKVNDIVTAMVSRLVGYGNASKPEERTHGKAEHRRG